MNSADVNLIFLPGIFLQKRTGSKFDILFGVRIVFTTQNDEIKSCLQSRHHNL